MMDIFQINILNIYLDKYIEYLLETNNYILDKTIQYVELLSKKSITNKFIDIIKEYETSKEITYSSLAIIQNANLQLQQIREKHDILQEKNNTLQEKHDKLQDDYNTRIPGLKHVYFLFYFL